MIKWNEYTWYSKLLAVIFFIGVLPAWTFYLGTQYELAVEAQEITPAGNMYAFPIPTPHASPTQAAPTPKTTPTPSTTPTSTAVGQAPTIITIEPGTANVGAQVVISGRNFTSTGDTILFGAYKVADASSADGKTITFTAPSSAGPDCKAGQACPMYAILLKSGSYQVSIENSNGTSNAAAFTLTGTQTNLPQ